jgi:predicted DNA-binding antitoxin AbrB/MazE fold protein
MTVTVEAIYENGVLKPKQPLELKEGTEVRLAISPLEEDYDPLDAVIGICTEGPDISLAARHDELLYGLKPHEENKP